MILWLFYFKKKGFVCVQVLNCERLLTIAPLLFYSLNKQTYTPYRLHNITSLSSACFGSYISIIRCTSGSACAHISLLVRFFLHVAHIWTCAFPYAFVCAHLLLHGHIELLMCIYIVYIHMFVCIETCLCTSGVCVHIWPSVCIYGCVYVHIWPSVCTSSYRWW
jgi:hypothetical protein